MSETTAIRVIDIKAIKSKRRSIQRKNALAFFRRMTATTSAKVGLILFLIIVLASIFAPLIAPYKIDAVDIGAIYSPPSAKHLFGTDNLGRDIFSRMLYGGRYSLAMGFAATIFGNVIGIALGCVAGYFGGIPETIILRLCDVWESLPNTLICIVISTVLGPGIVNTVFALSLAHIAGGVRMIRAMILSERSKEYLEAAESINCSKPSIMFKHLLPNVIQPMIVSITLGIGGIITQSAGLSYIGLGVQPPTPEWGAMLSAGSKYVMTKPYLLLFPGLVIAITVLALNLLGDGVRDALDPKLNR